MNSEKLAFLSPPSERACHLCTPRPAVFFSQRAGSVFRCGSPMRTRKIYTGSKALCGVQPMGCRDVNTSCFLHLTRTEFLLIFLDLLAHASLCSSTSDQDVGRGGCSSGTASAQRGLAGPHPVRERLWTRPAQQLKSETPTHACMYTDTHTHSRNVTGLVESAVNTQYTPQLWKEGMLPSCGGAVRL